MSAITEGVGVDVQGLYEPNAPGRRRVKVNDQPGVRWTRSTEVEVQQIVPTNVPTLVDGPRARSYADLLAFLARQDWYSNPTPNGRYEQTLANARGALLDCLVYVPTTGTLE